MPAHTITHKDSSSHASKPFFGSQPARSRAFFNTPEIQRQCADCETEKKIQPQLQVHDVDDPLEAEADLMADHIVGRKAATIDELPVATAAQQEAKGADIQASSAPVVQRQCESCANERRIQPPLEIVPVDDPLEMEADAMADHVVRRQIADTDDDNTASSQSLPDGKRDHRGQQDTPFPWRGQSMSDRWSRAGAPVSPKLTVAAADDPAERVADELAERVLSRPGQNLSPPMPPPSTEGESASKSSQGEQVHRLCEACIDEEADPVRTKSSLDASARDAMEAPEAVHEVLRSAGQPMSPSVRHVYEPRFGFDFSDVRVHSDEAAAASAEEIGALAYTAGSHVVFGRGQCLPETAAGERLMAHELAHVVQEGHAPGALHRKIGSPRVATADLEATMPAPPEEGPASKLTGDEARDGRAAQLVENALSSPGKPLDATSRAFFEPRFGWDFKQVQVHSGTDAAASARALGARGYAVGQHVVLGEGQTPDGESGRRLMAHELAHTIQQSTASTPNAATNLAISSRHAPSEEAGVQRAEAPMLGLEMQGLAPLGASPLVQRRLGPRTLTPPFDPRECALLLRVANTDMAGPSDAPPGRFKEVWAEFCIPKPRLDDPERGVILGDDEAFGPFQQGSYIRVQRFAEIELESGITIEFSIRGFQRTKDSFTTLPANAKEVEALLEADGTSMFELDIEAMIDSSDTRGVTLIGSFEHAKKSNTRAPGLHSLMRNVGASEWAAVLIDNPTQYRNILARLLQADPYLNRFTVSLKNPPPSKSFGTKSEAEAASGSASGFVAGTVITKGADKKYHVYYLQPMDLFWTSERARHPNSTGMPPRYAFLDEEFQSLRVGGRTIDKLSAFADAYYLDAVAAQRRTPRTQDALVYQTPDGFYGRYALSRADAFAWWKKLDAMDAGKVGHETLRHWKGYDLGQLVSLYVRGQAESHVVDAGYLAARDRYKQNKRTLEADRVQVGTKDYDPMSWFLLAASGKEDNFRYLNGELDRPTEAGGGTLLGQIQGSEKLQQGIASFAFDRVNDAARREAKAIVKQMQSMVSQLGTSEADLKRVLLAYPKLDAETRKAVVQIMGVEEGDQENTIKTLSSMSNALDIYRGLEVGGVSIARLTRSIAKTRTELGDLLKGLESGKILAVGFEGDFGTIVRERAYRRLGFSKLKGAEFPHHDSRGRLPDYLEGDEADSANLLERIYGNYVAAQDTANLLFKILVVAAVIAVTAALIFFSGGLAVVLGEAFFGGSLVAEIVIGAAIFTGLSEGLAQAMGQGALNTKDRDFGLGNLGVSFLLNVATFGIFRGLSSVMKGWSLAARLGTTYVSFLAFSIGAHMATHGGKLPQGAEWGWLLYETTLMFVLLEAGGYFGRDAFRKMQIAGRNVRAGDLAQTLEGIKTDAETLRGDYNKAFETGSRAEKLALADRYSKVLARQEKLLTELRLAQGDRSQRRHRRRASPGQATRTGGGRSDLPAQEWPAAAWQQPRGLHLQRGR